MTAADRLAEGIGRLQLDIAPGTQQKLLAYGALLMKWNRVYNLTAIRDEAAMVDLHLLDSLTVLPYIDFPSIADIGSGGGLPGIPLAICRPDMQVTLVETVGKKASFLQQARIELGLNNLTVQNERVENLDTDEPFSAITSRAFSSLRDFVTLTGHLAGPASLWLAMKGVYPKDEIAELPPNFTLTRSVPLHIPGVDVERHLLFISRN